MDHSSDRRRFLQSSLGAAAFAAPALGFINACKTTSRPETNQTSLAGETALTGLTIRKSAIDPSNQNNIELYRKAVAGMKATTFPIKKDGQDISWWDAHAQIHDGFCPHGNWFFLPWHRGYLHYFEKVCREFCGDPSFALPYWDWTADSALPDAFTDGDEKTNALNNATRNVKPREALNLRETSAENVQKIMEITDFATFAGGAAHRPRSIDRSIPNEQNGYTGRLEAGPHNKVHATMGGDMGTFISPKDPIFWLHHCNVDRLWTVWVASRTTQNQAVMPSDFVSSKDVAKKPETLLDGEDYRKSKIGGYYKIEKAGDVFKASPAELAVNDVYDAIRMGLAYQPYVKPVVKEPEPSPVQEPVVTSPTTQAPITTPAVPAPTAAEQAAQDAIAKEGEKANQIDPATGLPKFIPVPISSKMMKSRWKTVIRNVITAKTSFVSSFSLVAASQNSAQIKNSPALKAAMAKALGLQSNFNDDGTPNPDKAGPDTFRLILRGIPFPTNPQAELHLYLNSTVFTGENTNPNYVGSVSFFGHKHDGASMSAAFDILPTIKRIVSVNSEVFNVAESVVLTAVWKNTTKYDDLSALNFSIDHLEMVR
ncbi:MAG: hypothetical protein EOP07_02630 [Proteobacteria bacterium]|nr:MAG: hypothetical protein EOP07_02630 [Pseudomonadota bacterium]